jgi:CRP-like cAMP-binding protein
VFRRLTRDHPEFGICILPAVEKMLNRSLTMVGEMAFRSVRYRLIRYLCEMAEHDGRQTSAGIVIDGAPHGDDLAMAIGAARQSVSTVLAELIRSGDIQRPAPRTFVIPDVESLREELRVLR